MVMNINKIASLMEEGPIDQPKGFEAQLLGSLSIACAQV